MSATSTGPRPGSRPASRPASRSASRAWLLAAGLLGLAVLLAALVLLRLVTGAGAPSGVPDGDTPLVAGAQVVSEEAKDAGLDRSSRMVETILSYDAASFDEDLATSRDLLAGDLVERYTATMEALRQDSAATGSGVDAEVVASAIISVTGEDLKALLFVNQTTTGDDLDEPRTELDRVVVTLHRGEDGWRVTGLDVS